jgi:signal transduction histidine kinase/ligand-binding sensor domain-containing protein
MSRTLLVLLCPLASFAFSAFAGPQDIQLIQVPIVRESHVQFFRLPWPSTRFMVRTVVQDNQGFLWLTSADGLRRYDAYGFMRVPESEDFARVGYIIANSTMKDRSGRIWFGLDDSLDRYDPASGNFKQYKSQPGDTCSIALAHQISEDQDGLIWLATDEGIAALDPVKSKATCYRPRSDVDPSIGDRRVASMLISRDNTLWMTSSAGVDTFDPRTRSVLQHFRLETNSGQKFRCTVYPATPFQDSTGTIWVGLMSGGDLASINGTNGQITVYSFEGTGLPVNTSSGVASIQEDNDGSLWLGTNRLGLVKLTPDRKQALWYQSNPDEPESLNGNRVVAVFKDREGTFWATTNAGDVYRFEPHAPLFRYYRHQPGNPHSLNDNFVTAAYTEDLNTIWIGTVRGLNRVDRSTGQVTRYEDPVFSRGVNAIAKDRRGDLWFGTNGNGLVRFNPHSGYLIYSHVASDPRTLSYDTVGALWIDRDGTLWVATDFGLNRFDAATSEFRKYAPEQQTLTQYNSIAEESDGVLWLATGSHGVHRFDPRTGNFTAFKHRPGDPHSLSHDRVNSVYVDRSGEVWAATFRGLDKFNSRDGTFTSYDSRSGLSADTAVGILEDENGYLWVSTTDGLSRLDQRTQTFTKYHTSDGLLTDLFSEAASAGPWRAAVAARGPGGEMFFGSYDGLLAFFPNQMIERTFSPPVVLTSFRLFGEPVQVGKGPLKEPIWTTRSLELSARSILSLDFSALSYIDPARTRYRYKLQGLEQKWYETDSTHRTATYTTLPPGDYTFQVQARTSHSGWAENGAAMRIRILPPWYATTWVRLFAVSAFCAVVWALYRQRMGRLAHEFNVKLEARVDERTRIARELHDTLLQSFNGLLLRFRTVHALFSKRPDQALTILEDTIDEARQALTEGRKAVQGLRPSAIETHELTEAIQTLAEELASDPTHSGSAEVRLTVEGTPRKKRPLIRDEIYRIASEGLRNAFHHAEARHIEVQLRYGEKSFELRVRDDGKGIDPKFLADEGPAGHFGLRGMRERAQQIGAQLTVWSAPGSGTELVLSVPGALAYDTARSARGSWLPGAFAARAKKPQS